MTKASKLQKQMAANLALAETTNNARIALENAKPKKWVTIVLEIARIIIAALSGASGAALL